MYNNSDKFKNAVYNLLKLKKFKWLSLGVKLESNVESLGDEHVYEFTDDADKPTYLNADDAKEKWKSELKNIVESNNGVFKEADFNDEFRNNAPNIDGDYTWKDKEDEEINYVISYKFTTSPYSTYSDVRYEMVKTYLSAKNTTDLQIGEKVSVSYELQDTVSTWYKALRAIALVGLLSVLVYIGIRIIISSTGQEKAKYKKMIGDWLAAMCILFILQYIMVFILEITQKITDVLSVNAIGEYGEDVLMSNLRTDLGVSTDFSSTFPELLMYLVLVIYTVMFTIQYLKRVVYMAFFTMIAPLIALTYPIDKIKDGQAQAFSTWLREYIFNALLQPMHLLLYVMFVSSAMNFVGSNPLYAIVAIGFLLPAEKFFRKMFGFDKATTSNQFGAAAGGALIMNAINKMGHSSGKKAAGGSGSSGASGGSEGSAGSAPRYISAPSGSTTGGGTKTGPSSSTFGETISNAKYTKGNLMNGAKTLAGHYVNKGNFKKMGKGLGRTARKVGVGAVGAATLGTVGLAAGIATGDLGNVLKYGAAGGAAGYMGANSVGDKLTEFEKQNRERMKEGAQGTDEYNTRNSIKELNNDNDFNRVCKDLGITDKADKEKLIREFHSNGITSSADIKKAMNAGSRKGYRSADTDKLIAAAKIRQHATQYGMKKKDIEAELRSKGVVGTDLNNAMELIDML